MVVEKRALQTGPKIPLRLQFVKIELKIYESQIILKSECMRGFQARKSTCNCRAMREKDEKTERDKKVTPGRLGLSWDSDALTLSPASVIAASMSPYGRNEGTVLRVL